MEINNPTFIATCITSIVSSLDFICISRMASWLPYKINFWKSNALNFNIIEIDGCMIKSNNESIADILKSIDEGKT